jgi:outer membrane protein assembly factor BamB
MRSLVVTAVLAASAATWGSGADWPAWRGPEARGSSPERNLPLRWSAQENVAFRLALPSAGAATPIVAGDRVFVTAVDGDSVWLWAVDRRTGAVAWKKAVGPGAGHAHRKHNMGSPSPVTDGRSVFALTGTGILKGFALDGKELWQRDLQKDYGPFGLNWGYASSPLLDAGTLYVPVLHGMNTDAASYLLGIEAATGKTRFRVERPTDARAESPDSYITPAIARRGAAAEIVITGGDVVTGHDPRTGAELWRASGLNPGREGNYRVVASPVVVGDLVVAPTRIKPMLALRAFGRGDVTAKVLWSFDQGPDVPTPATDGTLLYVVTDRGLLWCLDLASGRALYGPQRLRVGTYSASPLLADGRLYVISEDGLTSVVKAGPAFELLAENALDDFTVASPAAAGGQLFLRTRSALYAIGAAR